MAIKSLRELKITPNDALLVIDVQNDFCPGGSLPVAHGDEVVPPLNELIQMFLADGQPIYKSRDWHPAQTKHFADYGGTWPVHCVQGTYGAEFHPDLIDDVRIHIISKGLGDEDCYSAFDGTDLAKYLRANNIQRLIVGGLATDYCVKQTVLDGLKLGFKVLVVNAAVRAVNINPRDGILAISDMIGAGADTIGLPTS